MWPKLYRDYPLDKPLIKHRVESGKGIVGCEMHELNGWGTSYHLPSHYRGTHESKRKPYLGNDS